MGKGGPVVRLVLSETPPDPELAQLIQVRTGERLAQLGVDPAPTRPVRPPSAQPAKRRAVPRQPRAGP
jgi:hypothetical protein